MLAVVALLYPTSKRIHFLFDCLNKQDDDNNDNTQMNARAKVKMKEKISNEGEKTSIREYLPTEMCLHVLFG